MFRAMFGNIERIKYSAKLIFIDMFLPNIRKKWYDKEKLSDMERYMLCLAEQDIEVAHKIGKGDKFMKESIEEQVGLCLDEDLRESYDHELEYKKSYFKDGVAQGIEKERKDIIRNLVSYNYSKEEISKIVNISIDKVDSYLED